MAYIPKGNSAWLLRKAINRSDSAIADLETNLTTLARTASNTGTSTTTQVLFNDAGIVNGDAGLVYNKTTDALSVGGALGVTGTTTLTGAATVQGLTVGKGGGSVIDNTALGANVFNGSTTGLRATGVGYETLKNLTIGSNVTAVGHQALTLLTSGSNNTGIGDRALASCVTGTNECAVGYTSLNASTDAQNTAIGSQSLYQLGTGNANTAVGYLAGSNQTTGSNNAFFGSNVQADDVTGSNQYNYGNSSVASHKFRNGNLVVANGRIDVGGASAALRTSSLTADAFTTTVSTGVGVNNYFGTITIAFTVNNNACTGIIDCQFAGFNQVWGDFLFSSNQLGIATTMRSAASAGVTGVLTITGSGTIYTLVITCPTTLQFPSVNLRVSSGGGAGSGSLMSSLPVVTFA